MMSLFVIGLGFLLPNFTSLMQILAMQHNLGVASALIQTTHALGGVFTEGIVGIVVARISITSGSQAGLLCCVVVSDYLGMFPYPNEQLCAIV